MPLKIYSQGQLQKPDPIIQQQHIQLQQERAEKKGKKNPYLALHTKTHPVMR